MCRVAAHGLRSMCASLQGSSEHRSKLLEVWVLTFDFMDSMLYRASSPCIMHGNQFCCKLTDLGITIQYLLDRICQARAAISTIPAVKALLARKACGQIAALRHLLSVEVLGMRVLRF